MALYRISPQPLQLIQPAHPAALLVNVGNEICYLDTVSTVSDRSYSLRLDPGQSVNFGGNSNLWAVCSLGLSTEISLLKDSNTTITPIRNVKIDGDVSLSGPVQIDGTVQVAGSVDIGGGTVNVGTISGNVNVDGSTINVGNNVRLWGGSDYIGTYTYNIPPGNDQGPLLSLLTMFPSLLNTKYFSYYLVCNIATPPHGVATAYRYLLSYGGGVPVAKYFDWQGIYDNAASNDIPFNLNFKSVCMFPAYCEAANIIFRVGERVPFTAATSFTVTLFGSYSIIDSPRLASYGSQFTISSGNGQDGPVLYNIPPALHSRKIAMYTSGSILGNIVLANYRYNQLSIVEVVAGLATGKFVKIDVDPTNNILKLIINANAGSTGSSQISIQDNYY